MRARRILVAQGDSPECQSLDAVIAGQRSQHRHCLWPIQHCREKRRSKNSADPKLTAILNLLRMISHRYSLAGPFNRPGAWLKFLGQQNLAMFESISISGLIIEVQIFDLDLGLDTL